MKVKTNKGEIIETDEVYFKHRMMCGDSTIKEDVDKLMNEQKATITFTSPPYNVSHNIGYNKKSKYLQEDNNPHWIELLNKSMNLALSNSKYCFYNIQFLANNKRDLITFLHKNKDQFCDIAFWKKSQVQPAISSNVMNSQIECIFIFSSSGNSPRISTANFRGNINNFIETHSASKDNPRPDLHNATFPIDFVSFFIKNFTQQEDLILDNFGGLGTTLIASEQLNRKCFMMEIDPTYCSIILERWESLTNKKATLINKNPQITH